MRDDWVRVVIWGVLVIIGIYFDMFSREEVRFIGSELLIRIIKIIYGVS